jgi:hypothetical protein
MYLEAGSHQFDVYSNIPDAWERIDSLESEAHEVMLANYKMHNIYHVLQSFALRFTV